MAKVEQALILDPPTELHFKAPLTESVTTSYLNLTNPTDRPVCFKVKTTAPKTYCVRPNNGVVPPKDTVVVAIMLHQPVDVDFSDRNKHKFMVQTVFSPDGDIDQDSLWRNTLPENLMNSKLKCVFDEAKEIIQTSAEIVEQPKVENEKILPKVSPEISTTPPALQIVSSDATVQNLMNSNKKLKQELNELALENSRLKEEGLRLRVSKSSGFSTEFPSSEILQGSKSLQPQAADGEGNQMSHTFIIVVFAVVFFVGIFIGKKFF